LSTSFITERYEENFSSNFHSAWMMMTKDKTGISSVVRRRKELWCHFSIWRRRCWERDI